MIPRRLVLDLRDRRPLWAIPGWAVEEVRAALPAGWEVVEVRAEADGRGDGGAPSDEALAAVRGAEVYAGFGVPRALFLAATAGEGARLRWAHSAAAGVGAALYPEMRASDVVLTNSAGIHAEPMAETAMGMLLHFARGLDLAVRAQAARHWDKEPFERLSSPVREVAGTTLGILGLGGIGRAVARRGAALGMRVVATRRRAGDVEGVDVLSGRGALDRLLAASDHLVVAAPLTDETRGMLGARELALLPDGAVLVNLSRGGVVDEEALVAALRDGRLRGAGLDVFATEPLPPESPLWDLPNTLLTPHVSGTSRQFWRRQVDLLVANLRRHLSGDPLLNTVDKSAGY